MSHHVERWLSVLESVDEADSLESAAAAVAMQLGAPLDAAATAFFVVLHGRVFLEFWHPADPAMQTRLRKSFLKLAVEAAEGRPAPRPGESNDLGLESRVYVLPLKYRLTGVLCVGCVPGLAAPGASVDEPFERLVRLVGARLMALQDIAAERTKSGQYERWFRVSDRQIRALDAERQKFAALVQSIDTNVFVADIKGTIRWTSRPLTRHAQAGEGGNPWLGRPCRELCAMACAGNGIACGECLVGRVAGCGSELTVETPTPGDPCGEMRRVTALPIRDLEGHAQEVMVVIEGSAAYPSAAA